MNRKMMGVFGSMLVLVILVIPINCVLAPKLEKIDVEFYGFPKMGLNTVTETRDAGNSDNHFLTWVILDWEFAWDYDVIPGIPPTVNPIDVFASGNYWGLWIMHGYEPGFPLGTFTHMNNRGRHTVTVSDWDGMTGEFVLQGVTAGKWNIVSGTIGGMTLHGGGVIEKEPDVSVWKYTGVVWLTP